MVARPDEACVPFRAQCMRLQIGELVVGGVLATCKLIKVVSRARESVSAMVATSAYESEKTWAIIAYGPALPGMKTRLADEACGQYR